MRLQGILFGLIIVLSSIFCLGLWIIARQGLSEDEYRATFGDDVRFDANGIPTIEMASWDDAVEASGFIVASERLWQMDTMRRAEIGRLSELFGDGAIDRDRERWNLGISDLLDSALELLPSDQRSVCERYAKGVNRFIDEYSNRWGIEFALLRYKPEHWTCKDSLAVLLLMSEDLGGSSARERSQWEWRKRLPIEWQQVIYSNEHPWNEPIFGDRTALFPGTPKTRIPLTDPRKVKIQSMYVSPLPIGSNSWVYRGTAGTFLANDPHLPNRVPQIWYASRIFLKNSDKWSTGVQLPGIPGLVIGMNQDIAWGFTNTGEDVDDLLIEKISSDGKSFETKSKEGEIEWRPLTIRPYEILTKSGQKIAGNYRATDFGPIIEELDKEKGMVLTRRWIGLRPEFLKLPTLRIMSTTNWEQFNQSVDGFTIPSQNVMFADRKGTIGYRTSGRGIKRTTSSMMPLERSAISWQGVWDASERRRLALQATPEVASQAIVTANQRIWIDGIDHNWSSDDRTNRIKEVLQQRNDLGVFDMQQLQHDTFARFSVILLQWVTKNVVAKSTSLDEKFQRWENWSGRIVDDAETFKDAAYLESRLTDLLLSNLANHFAKDVSLPRYAHFNRRAWLLTVLVKDDLLKAFGFDSKAVANFLVSDLQKSVKHMNSEPYALLNRWRTQHPFYSRIPLLGKIFQLTEIPQSGSNNTVKVEMPNFGASGRFVWNLNEPNASVWAFPIGQSGHVGSSHYREFQQNWLAGKYLEVFPTGHRLKPH